MKKTEEKKTEEKLKKKTDENTEENTEENAAATIEEKRDESMMPCMCTMSV